MAKMTHAEAKAHLEEGRSVGVYVGKKLVRVAKLKDLPSEAEMAQGDPVLEEAAREKLILERARIDAELSIINGAAKLPVSPDPGTGEGTGEGNEADDENDNGDLDDNDSSGNQGGTGGEPPANETPAQKKARLAAEAANAGNTGA